MVEYFFFESSLWEQYTSYKNGMKEVGPNSGCVGLADGRGKKKRKRRHNNE